MSFLDEFEYKIYQEEKLSSDDKNNLKDEDFGIPEERKFPLNDEDHVIQANRFFNKAEKKYKLSLAKRIIQKAKELKMDYSKWDTINNYIKKYDKQTVQESFQDTNYELPSGIGLRPANEKDLPMILEWTLQTMNSVYRTKQKIIDMINRENKENIDTIKIITDGNKDIGMYQAYPIDEGEWWYLAEIYLIPDYRGKGIGSTLIKKDVNSHDKLVLRVDPDNVKAIKLYKSLGFVVTKKEENSWIMRLDKTKISEFHNDLVENITESDKINKLIPIEPPKSDKVYFGSPINYMPEIDLDRPLFVSPYKGIASIFIWGDMSLQNRMPRGTYNLNYEEWINFDKNKMKEPLKEVNVYLEGAPFLEPFTIEQEGYIHSIDVNDYKNNFFKYPWMTEDLEYLIANTDNIKVEFIDSIKCKVKYNIKGVPTPDGKTYGPTKKGILQFIHNIANEIHMKYKNDKKEPTGNQNCLLCTWCAEANMRGNKYLPRAIYSPRDSALSILPKDIIDNAKIINPKNFNDMMEYLKSVKESFARWYCHVKWGHGTGGHEFLIIKIDENEFSLMDPQQNIIKPLTSEDKEYWMNIDWEETFVCRVDDKPFKYTIFEHINDPSNILPFDEEKDIPYMKDKGIIQEGMWQDIRNGVNPYSTYEVCEEMINTLKSYKYGIPIDGKITNVESSEYYDKHYKLLSPDEFEKYGGGICWDYVEWEEQYLKDCGRTCKKYYLYNDTKTNDTHTFITVPMNDNDTKIIYPEASFKTIQGVRVFNDLKSLMDFLSPFIFKINGNDKKYKEIKWYLFEYEGHPPYGSSSQECMKYFSNAEPILEGIVKNPSVIKESYNGGIKMKNYPNRFDNDQIVVSESMFDAGFNNLRFKLAEYLKDKFNVTNVIKGMLGQQKFDIIGDNTKTTISSTMNGCKCVTYDNNYGMHVNFNNIPLSKAFDKISELFDTPQLLLEQTVDEDTLTIDNVDLNNQDVEINIDIDSFGSDNSQQQNEYDQNELKTINDLIADETEAVTGYFNAAKHTHIDALSRLFSDIGAEESFHIEQLLYAKSTLTGEPYEPRDEKVKSEYEELKALGMDSETAMNTAIDKVNINKDNEVEDSEFEEIQQDVETLEYAIFQNELIMNMFEEQFSKSKYDDTVNTFVEMYIQESVNNVNKLSKSESGSLNPIKLLIKGIRFVIKVLVSLAHKIRDFINKNKIRNKQKIEWIKKHGIKGLFNSKVSLYFWSDKKGVPDIMIAYTYIDLLERLTRDIAKSCGFNIQEYRTAIDRNSLKNRVSYNTIQQGLSILNGVVYSKTPVVVTDTNEEAITIMFFGFNQNNKFITRVDANNQPIADSQNIYSLYELVISEANNAAKLADLVLEQLQKEEATTYQNSIYHTNNKLYNQSVKYMQNIVKGYNVLIKALTHDINACIKLDNGLLQQTRESDEALSRNEKDPNREARTSYNATKQTQQQQQTTQQNEKPVAKVNRFK